MPWLVQCDNFTMPKPYRTREEAERVKENLDRHTSNCHLPHRLVECDKQGRPVKEQT